MTEQPARTTDRTGRSYRDLDAWTVGVDLAVACYALTQSFPSDERFGLTSQIRRSSTSIPANIAEGYGRQSRQDFIRFCRIAQGSVKELETHMIVAQRIGMVSREDISVILDDCDRIGRMLGGLIRSLQERPS